MLQREWTQIRKLYVFRGAGSGILLPNRQRNAEIPGAAIGVDGMDSANLRYASRSRPTEIVVANLQARSVC